MTVLIPNKIGNLVERYLSSNDRQFEMGGYFFGSNGTIRGFLPIPNYAENQRNTYSLGHTLPIAEHYSRMLSEPIIADMHTHPSGAMPSEQDGRYVAGMRWPYHVIIADRTSSYDWFVVDSALRKVPHLYSEVEVEAYAEVVAGEMGLEYLGQVYLTPKGEIIGKSESVGLLTLDQDYYRFKLWLAKQNTWHRWSYAEASRALGISVARVKKAHQKHEKGKEVA